MNAGERAAPSPVPLAFLLAAGVALLVGSTAGALGAVRHGWTATPFSSFPFEILRPLHTTFVVAWIFLAYTGCLYAFLPDVSGGARPNDRLARVHFALFLAAGVAAFGTYAFRIYRGREYLEFVTPISAAILAGALLLLFNFYRTARRRRGPWPVYLWMWATGLLVFPYTFVEGHLWLLPHFGSNLARDLTVQWKSYGSLIGSWNMVVYGLSFYVLARLRGDESEGYRPTAFAFYWLSLLNLMFNFGHHNYQGPQAASIKTIGFVVSMTELAVLAEILLERTRPWDRSRWKDPAQRLPRAFLAASSAWLLVNLVLAILISVPSINAVTHGTHVTVAHAMGCTIGINSMILFAAGWTVVQKRVPVGSGGRRLALAGFALLNLGLAGLFTTLLLAGGVRGVATMREGANFHQTLPLIRPFLQAFVVSGAAAFAGVVLLVGTWTTYLVRALRAPADFGNR